MKKDTLVLKGGTVIELEAGASLSSLKVLSADRNMMLAAWEKLCLRPVLKTETA